LQVREPQAHVGQLAGADLARLRAAHAALQLQQLGHFVERETNALGRCRWKPLKRVGRLLRSPGNTSLADPCRPTLGEFVELAVQERSSDLDKAVRTDAAPAHQLALDGLADIAWN
jgi:hypothetical protein